jgi:hypothetical protein
MKFIDLKIFGFRRSPVLFPASTWRWTPPSFFLLFTTSLLLPSPSPVDFFFLYGPNNDDDKGK